MKKRYEPIFLDNRYLKNYKYSSRRGGLINFVFPPRDRKRHSDKLIQLYTQVLQNKNSNLDGIYIDFTSQKDFQLKTESLESLSKNIRLVNLKIIDGTTQATLYVPEKYKDNILNKFENYANKDKDTKNGKPANEKLVASIEEIKSATIKSFWNGSEKSLPNKTREWCEVWLINDNDTFQEHILNNFEELCEEFNIELNLNDKLVFPERIVKLAKLNTSDITTLILNCKYLAEIRPSITPSSFWIDIETDEQYEWSNELYSRITLNPDTNVSICILDTGVNNGHPLLKDILKDSNRDSFDMSWKVDDHGGHGTAMSGLAAYGCLKELMETSQVFNINYSLASYKILPPRGENEKKLWGYVTSQAVDSREIEEPNKKHIFCMAVTSASIDEEDYHIGKPSSWSSEIDRILFTNENSNRLFIISAGNLPNTSWGNYMDANNLSEIHEPGQAWNALIIGAYTEKDRINDPEKDFTDYTCIAKSGQLSPFTTTSLLWDKQWPNKPDVVFEGGNALIDKSNFTTIHDDLSLLTTNWKPFESFFTIINATSAATALASNFAAQLYCRFPNAQPETIRALIVHSANWTKEMYDQYIPKGNSAKKNDYFNLLRACGYGVPNLERAINCYDNSLTLISENTIQPFIKEKNNIKMNEMNFYELPWPKDILLSIGNSDIQMKVTLSYFIEPSPSELERYKINRYQYQSFGLRFDVNHPLESKKEFIERKNKYESDDSYISTGLNSSDYWLLGVNQRDRGSIISDIWQGKAADLATCNFVCVYPITGWWKTRENLKRYKQNVKYTLIVSIYSQEENIDLYTPVDIQINIPALEIKI